MFDRKFGKAINIRIKLNYFPESMTLTKILKILVTCLIYTVVSWLR